MDTVKRYWRGRLVRMEIMRRIKKDSRDGMDKMIDSLDVCRNYSLIIQLLIKKYLPSYATNIET